MIIIFLETKGILDIGVIESLAERVKEALSQGYHYRSLAVITCAASLAHYRLLGSVRLMRLYHDDLTSVPAEHLASLASCVTGRVAIKNVSGCDLVTVLDSVKSEWLVINSQSLGSEETQALVRAMESGVERVVLLYDVTLDIRDLMEYSGQGKCRRVECHLNTKYRRKELKTWAMSRNWTVTRDDKDCFVIERIKQAFLCTVVTCYKNVTEIKVD